MTTPNKVMPNTFQTPNVYIDEVMPYLTPHEFIVLMWAVRHILGWRSSMATGRYNLSISAFQKGYKRIDNGEFYPGCGLGRGTIINALDTLEQYGLMKKCGKADERGQEWELVMDSNEFKLDALRVRRDGAADTKRQRTEIAREKKGERSVGQTTLADVVAVCGTDQQRSVGQTGGWSVGQTHSLNPYTNTINPLKAVVTETAESPAVETTTTTLEPTAAILEFHTETPASTRTPSETETAQEGNTNPLQSSAKVSPFEIDPDESRVVQEFFRRFTRAVTSKDRPLLVDDLAKYGADAVMRVIEHTHETKTPVKGYRYISTKLAGWDTDGKLLVQSTDLAPASGDYVPVAKARSIAPRTNRSISPKERTAKW